MRTAVLIPCCAEDEEALKWCLESLHLNFAALSPVPFVVCDPERPPGRADATMLAGPRVTRNIRGRTWLSGFHDLVDGVLASGDFTHVLKTDADVLWTRDRLTPLLASGATAYGFIKWKADGRGKKHPRYWMGMGYGWSVPAWRELRKRWKEEHRYGTLAADGAEDVMTWTITSPHVAVHPIPSPHGIRWNGPDMRACGAATAIHAGQFYGAWPRAERRRTMGREMGRLFRELSASSRTAAT